jgi:hypothetical protein
VSPLPVERDTVTIRRKRAATSIPLETSKPLATQRTSLSLHSAQIMTADSASFTVNTSDGRTGDRHEFHISGALIYATLDSGGSTISVWASEPALPYDRNDPSAAVASRNFRLRMSRVQARGFRDQLVAVLKRGRRQASAES